jgi:hypothetical protein
MRRALLWLVLTLAVSACSSEQVNVAPTPPAHYVVTREGDGRACGLNLFVYIPIGTNDRTERAYQRALEDAQATGLMDTEVTDSWRYVFIGDLFCTAIHGTGYRSTQ